MTNHPQRYTKEQIIKAIEAYISFGESKRPESWTLFDKSGWAYGALDQHLEALRKPEKRKLKQNRLAFKWYKERAEFFKNTPDYEHRFCKYTYGIPILCAEDDQFATDYELTVQMLSYESRLRAMKHFDVTSLMGVKQFSEYLHTIEIESAKEGCILTHPDEYMDALMRQVA